MAKVVIFGTRDFASLARFYLEHDSEHEVAAYCVDREYLPEDGTFEGLPVLAFETVERELAPEEYRFFAPMSHRGMNRRRQAVFEQIKAKGYDLVSYISTKATTFPGLVVGENCFVLEDNTLQPFLRIGHNVVMWSGNHIGHHGVIKDHVFFTSHVVLSGHCIVEPFSFFGVNSTVKDGVRIAEGTLVAMSASINGDTEPWGVYRGVPAKKSRIQSKDVDF